HADCRLLRQGFRLLPFCALPLKCDRICGPGGRVASILGPAQNVLVVVLVLGLNSIEGQTLTWTHCHAKPRTRTTTRTSEVFPISRCSVLLQRHPLEHHTCVHGAERWDRCNGPRFRC